MKSLSILLALVAGLTVAETAAVSTASADVVRKTVVAHHGPFGHGCRTVRTVVRGHGGKHVIVRKVCR